MLDSGSTVYSTETICCWSAQEPITRKSVQLSIIAIEGCLSNHNQKRALIWSIATGVLVLPK